MSTNNALLPSDTYCPPEYVGVQAFLLSMENLKKAYDSTINSSSEFLTDTLTYLNRVTFTDAAYNTIKATILTSLGTATSAAGMIARLTALKNNAATWFGGVAHSVMPSDVREALKSKRFIVISWQDLNILINLMHENINAGNEISTVYTEMATIRTAIIAGATATPPVPPTPEQVDALNGLAKIALHIEKMRHNIHALLISFLLNDITPVGIVTANTMVMNMDCTLKMPMNLDNFDSLSYQIMKVRNINEVRIKSPYFKSTLTSKDGNLYTGFYYVVPKVESLDLDQLNQKSIDAVRLIIKGFGVPKITRFSYDIGSGVDFTDVTTTKELESYVETLDMDERARFPIYTKMSNLDSFTFGVCIGKHVHRSFMDLNESNWFAFNPLNYRTIGVRLRSIKKRKIDIPSVATTVATLPATGGPLATNTPFFNSPMAGSTSGKKSSSKSSSRTSDKDALI